MTEFDQELSRVEAILQEYRAMGQPGKYLVGHVEPIVERARKARSKDVQDQMRLLRKLKEINPVKG